MKLHEFPDELSHLVPPDFRPIEGYRDLTSFDARMWVLHFLIRSYWKYQQDFEEFRAEVGEPPRGIMTVEDLKGYMEDHNTTDWPWDLVSTQESRRNPGRLAFGAVRSLTLHDIMHILRISEVGEIVAMARDIHWKNFYFSEQPEVKKFLKRLLDSFDQGRSIFDRATISVDLKAPNDVIVNAFHEWLKEARSELGHGQRIKFFSDSFRHRCIEQRVLQYIDITNWNIWKGQEPTHAQVGVLLFPDYVRSGDNLADRVSKTVRTLADRMMDWDVLVGLQYQVLAERKNSGRQPR
jgi:hypothetical protein